MPANDFEIIQLCCSLRKRSTPEEKKLWTVLRNRKLQGIKFLRQHPLKWDSFNGEYKFYIADFYAHEIRTVIEIDGLVHIGREEYDQNRDIVLKNLGIRTLRILNKETENINGVLKKIEEFIFINTK